MRQVAGGTEQDDRARIRDPLQSEPFPEGIGLCGRSWPAVMGMTEPERPNRGGWRLLDLPGSRRRRALTRI